MADSMEPKDIGLAMVRELERRAHERGYGSVKELTAHLGVSRTYFAELRRGGGSLTVDRLFAALDFLGADWVEFIATVLGEGRRGANRDLTEPEGPMPEWMARRVRELEEQEED